MVESSEFRLFALTFKDVIELKHFERASFKVKGKIFATLNEERLSATVRLSQSDQANVISRFHNTTAPVPGAWGKKGWTILDLELVDVDDMEEIVTMAYDDLINGTKTKNKIKFKI